MCMFKTPIEIIASFDQVWVDNKSSKLGCSQLLLLVSFRRIEIEKKKKLTVHKRSNESEEDMSATIMFNYYVHLWLNWHGLKQMCQKNMYYI